MEAQGAVLALGSGHNHSMAIHVLKLCEKDRTNG